MNLVKSSTKSEYFRTRNIIIAGVLLAMAQVTHAQVPINVLRAFSGGNSGANPWSPLIQGVDGHFYGTTNNGGTSNLGTIFRLTADGSLTVLFEFTGAGGAHPLSSLLQGRDGYLYGTTISGGSGWGTVFKLSLSGDFALLHAFMGTDGQSPNKLIQASDGNFYGTTSSGGGTGFGTIFRMIPAGTLTTLHSFTSGTAGLTNSQAGLLQASDGNFYGTTSYGGAFQKGTVFRMTPGGVVTILHDFTGASTDGAHPRAELIQATDGTFYGTTQYEGGTAGTGCGTVFKLTPSGNVTALHAFTGGSNGCNPAAPLVQASDGNFYGTTGNSGPSGGVVFQMNPAGTIITLYDFAAATGINGRFPIAALIQGADGNLYGTAALGGASDLGVVFRLQTLCRNTITPSYAAGTLNLSYRLRTSMPTLWTTSIAVQGNVYKLWSVALPILSPEVSGSVAIPLPSLGHTGILTTLTTPAHGILCSDWTTVQTSVLP